ncbi:LPS-assembly protein LptD [Methylocapsa sp. S129]|uniref:LPS-assembly protein LptD n=1 Tax=Methylocapsa sp. S129 TaxID=1641869 RepID=UPI001FF03ED8|nr:LPS-assembly protein LptD [Methylocapsa sp. S129]
MLFAALLMLGGASPILAQAPAAPPAADEAKKADKIKKPDKMIVEANELVFDKDKNTVSAVGNAQLYYQGRILEADRVTYDRNTKRVFAEGHAKLTDERGDVTYGSKFDLTDNFRDGFIESVQTINVDKTRFTSPRAERSDGDTTVFEKGIYTACEPCKDHPERPPLWQVRAARVIHNQQTHVVYYEDAWLEVAGVPLAYLPYFSAPDPTVNRLSGLLTPQYSNDSNLGTGIGIPYFFNLAPNYDLTVDPIYYFKQGLFGDAEWRHRLDNGAYSIRLTGIDQQDPGAFNAAPYGAGSRELRGSLESQGLFYINDKWKYGWDITLLSDKFYYNDYKIKVTDLSNYYFQDVVSSVYLRGQGDRGFFDLSGYRFEGLTAYDFQQQQPIAAPVLDYNKMMDLPPERSYGIGGQVTIDVNMTNISRTAALYQAVGAQTLDKAYSLYNVCETAAGLPTYTPGKCLLRGIAGDYARATAQVSWQRKYVDPIGEEWTPLVFARVDGETTQLNDGQTFTFVNGTVTDSISNSSQPAFFAGQESETTMRGMAGVGLEYRYPFVSTSALGRQVVEPIAQVIIRPNEYLPKLQPNEDAQSLVFDDTNLFEWNKYSGYDRIEGGARANYGLQYTADFSNGGHVNVVGGESIQLFGNNSYEMADAANTGLESGLDKKYSNFVAGETITPFDKSPLSFTSKQQFDSTTFALTRLDAITSLTFKGLTASMDYARYDAQPELGWLYNREGVVTSATYKFMDHWNVNASLVLDMSRHYYDVPGQKTPLLDPTNFGFGIGYEDECTTLKINYMNTVSDPIANTPTYRDQTLLIQLTLRTLGEVKTTTGVSGF